jgi:hypothetical protein
LADELDGLGNCYVSLVKLAAELLVGFSQFLVLLVGGAKLLKFSFQVVHSGKFLLHLLHSLHFLFEDTHLLGAIKDFEFQIEVQFVHFRNILQINEPMHIDLQFGNIPDPFPECPSLLAFSSQHYRHHLPFAPFRIQCRPVFEFPLEFEERLPIGLNWGLGSSDARVVP